MNFDHIEVNTQSSIRIAGSKVVRFDPFKVSEEAHDADVIFVTHAHYDHFDPESIANVRKEDTVFVAPASMAGEMAQVADEGRFIPVKPGDGTEAGGLAVETVPAFNKLKPFHPKRNQWVGYILTMDGIRYYVAGDTDALKELSSLRCDVALVPIGGTYTMTAKEAAGLINEMKPSAVIPTHYGSIVGKKEDADEFRSLVREDIPVVTKL